jgi:maltose alpha-D-glucosyltransferase/alpha-amylase
VTAIAWYRRAVFYEVPVYAFFDANGDGVGDFAGLESRLDYLQWLGVDCLWVLPFYESPLRDGGYDVSDFRAVLARYGTVDDVTRLLDAAHARGLRVIADMIVNHTSDQHPWFREARRPGSDRRDWYVWSETPDRYPDARVIFVDTHDSNWAWDEVAGSYYWHRFFDHQPDLNFDHPEVRAAIKDVVRYWLDRGFDGLRLDAVPYLFERDGTDGENLPETHAYLKGLRALVDAEYPGRILLAEANQWPQDVVAYFGDGDECHMAFHFPVMPRLFMALARQDASSIVDILERTPPIPDGAQWGIFLRNHDELTLEMVTAEERAYLYEQYAPDPRMRKNLGIRRRLAPLLDGERSRIELLHAVLLSLPGSPVLYYGDEIGMGDAYLLEDRDGVRTPMQWEPGPGAGFSHADPATFYLPVVDDPRYGPDRVNVADQGRDPNSLLNWVRSMLALRREHPVLAVGAYEPVASSNPAMFAFVRSDGSARILVLANLAATAQTTRLRIGGRWRDLRDGAIVDASTAMALPPHGFRWMAPVRDDVPAPDPTAPGP